MNVVEAPERFKRLLQPVENFVREVGAGTSGWLRPNIRVDPLYNSGEILREANSGSTVNGGAGQEVASRYLAVASPSPRSPAAEQTQQPTFPAGMFSRQAIAGGLLVIGALTVGLIAVRALRGR